MSIRLRKSAGLGLALLAGALTGVLVGFPATGAGQGGETFVEEMTLQNNNQNQSSTNQLEAGTRYRLKVSGTRDEHVGSPTPDRHQISDAFYCYEYTGTAVNPEPCNTSSPFFYDAIRLTVNGQTRELSTIDGQKPYSSSHSYDVYFTPTTTGPLVARASTCGCPVTGNLRIEIYRQSSTTTTPTTPTETTPDPEGDGGPWDGGTKVVRRPRPGRVAAVSSPLLSSCVRFSQDGQGGCRNVLVAVQGAGDSVLQVEGPNKETGGRGVVALIRACVAVIRLGEIDNVIRGFPSLLKQYELYKASGVTPAEFCAFLFIDIITPAAPPKPAKAKHAAAAASTCGRRNYTIQIRRRRGSRRTVVRRSRKGVRSSVRYTCSADDQGNLLLGITAPRGLRREFGKRLDLAVVTPRGASSQGGTISLTFGAVG